MGSRRRFERLLRMRLKRHNDRSRPGGSGEHGRTTAVGIGIRRRPCRRRRLNGVERHDDRPRSGGDGSYQRLRERRIRIRWRCGF